MTADIRFDLNLARLSLAVDAIGYLVVASVSGASAQAFVLATLLSVSLSILDRSCRGAFSNDTSPQAFGSGTAPAVQSAALCMLKNPAEESGKLFGAISMVQAIAAFVLSVCHMHLAC